MHAGGERVLPRLPLHAVEHAAAGALHAARRIPGSAAALQVAEHAAQAGRQAAAGAAPRNWSRSLFASIIGLPPCVGHDAS